MSQSTRSSMVLVASQQGSDLASAVRQPCQPGVVAAPGRGGAGASVQVVHSPLHDMQSFGPGSAPHIVSRVAAMGTASHGGQVFCGGRRHCPGLGLERQYVRPLGNCPRHDSGMLEHSTALSHLSFLQPKLPDSPLR